MSDAFDGAGREFHGPSMLAGIVILLASLVAIAMLWIAASWAMNNSAAPAVDGQTISGPDGVPGP